jgi:hypothetical protein
MSGGHFDYKNFCINGIADDIQHVIDNNKNKTPSEWGGTIGCFYPAAVIKQLKKAVKVLKQASVYAHRVDYLLSGDDGEESFLQRLKEDLKELEQTK